MISAAPNKVRVKGRVVERKAARSAGEDDPDFSLVTVQVQSTKPTRGSADTFADAVGKTIDVLVPNTASTHRAGDVFDADVSMTKPRQGVLSKS